MIQKPFHLKFTKKRRCIITSDSDSEPDDPQIQVVNSEYNALWGAKLGDNDPKEIPINTELVSRWSS